MIIDTSIIDSYLNEDDLNDLKFHWVFSNIVENKYLFEFPNTNKKGDVKKVYDSFLATLTDFTPFNEKVLDVLFPFYKELLKEVKIILILGCPSPYDAMCLKNNGERYLIFDLIRFSNYLNHDNSIIEIIRRIITHEFVHLCISKDYQLSEGACYTETLNYITFNEGLAHILAFKDNISDFNLTSYNTYYEESKQTLIEALREKDLSKQAKYIIEADSGSYWSKFASISGKLFFGKNIKNIDSFYSQGYKSFINKIIEGD